MSSSGVPEPGWFPDPGDPSAERWWSGEGWTDYTRAPEVAAVAVAVAEPEPVAEPAAPAPFPVPAAFADPVTPTLATAAADGFVMPDLAAEPLIAPAAAEPYATAVPTPEPSLAPGPPIPFVPAAPSSLPSTVDPDIASHYRKALVTVEPVSLGGAPAGSPSESGWGGMPMPPLGGSGTGGYDPSGGYRAPEGVHATSSYAAARTAANSTVASGSNKPAAIALSAGLGSLLALAFIFFGRILLVPSALSLVAVVMGIVGLALVKRTGAGLGPALSGLLLGLTTAIAVGASFVFGVLEATSVDTDELESQIVANSALYYGIEVVTANCPSNISILTTREFTCTAIDVSGVAHLVDVVFTDDGYVEWDLRL